jgi:hypothetical protein
LDQLKRLEALAKLSTDEEGEFATRDSEIDLLQRDDLE